MGRERAAAVLDRPCSRLPHSQRQVRLTVRSPPAPRAARCHPAPNLAGGREAPLTLTNTPTPVLPGAQGATDRVANLAACQFPPVFPGVTGSGDRANSSLLAQGAKAPAPRDSSPVKITEPQGQSHPARPRASGHITAARLPLVQPCAWPPVTQPSSSLCSTDKGQEEGAVC